MVGRYMKLARRVKKYIFNLIKLDLIRVRSIVLS